MIRTTDGSGQYKRIAGVGDKIPVLGVSPQVITYVAVGGETSIDLSAQTPSLGYKPGQHMLKVKRSSGSGELFAGIDYLELSTTSIGFPSGDALIAGEIVEITLNFTATGVMAVTPRPDCYTAVATTGQTLVSADFSWTYNAFASKGVGAVRVYLHGVLQTRGVDYHEVNLSNPNTNQIQFVDPLLGGENIVILPTQQVIDDAGASTQFNNARWSELATSPETHIQLAGPSDAGLVSTSAQSFAGVKTFTSGISLGNETLSVYDEGTWTPVQATDALSSATGKYIKIGNLAFIWMDITFNVTGSGALANITGLPFSVSGNGGGASIGYSTYATPITMLLAANTVGIYSYGAANISTATLQGQRFIVSGMATLI